MRVHNPSEAEVREYQEWLATRPPTIRGVGERLDPWTLYVMGETGQRVLLRSFFEDGTVSVSVLEQFNGPLLFERGVFGIDPLDLTPAPPDDTKEPAR